jgi:Uma2 family endonuclease
MPAKAALSEEEYLRTSFPGIDPEYRDGELVVRSMPDYIHGKTQLDFGAFLKSHRRERKLFASSEARLRVRPGRVMLSDVAVFWPNEPPARFPDTPPLIAIEILSEDDRLTEVRDKLQEYLDWGVPHVWLVDPVQKRFYVCRDGLHEVRSFAIPEVSLEVIPSDIFD